MPRTSMVTRLVAMVMWVLVAREILRLEMQCYRLCLFIRSLFLYVLTARFAQLLSELWSRLFFIAPAVSNN